MFKIIFNNLQFTEMFSYYSDPADYKKTIKSHGSGVKHCHNVITVDSS